jgi:Ferritin-like
MAPSDQVLDELTELAAVEHAVIAEYLQIAYVLGHGLPDPAPRPDGPAIAEAAAKILGMAQFVEMKHLKLVNELLVASGRPAQLGQAVGIDHSLGSGAMTVFGPLREDDLLALVDRETALAKAVDARYARLRPEVDPEDPGLTLGPTLELVLDRCGHHAEDMAEFTGMLAELNSADYLRVRRQTPSGPLEEALHKAGESHYGLIVALLSASLNHPNDELSSSLLSQAVTAMDSMDRFNAQLVGRGLLPHLSPPSP